MTANVRVFQNKILFLGSLLLVSASVILGAQELPREPFPSLRERAVVMHIVSRIVEQNKQVVWNEDNTRITIAGRPVVIKLVGAELLVSVQFTPFLRQSGRHTLVAQGQIWINVPDEGIRYHTTMQTIPLGFGEEVYFFPLGTMQSQDGSHIEIQLMMEPYSAPPADTGASDFWPSYGRRPGGGPQGASPAEARQDPVQKPEALSPEPPVNSGAESPVFR